ncbi:MAG: hypothetical protein H7287_12940 [Thermoleophilia bacterium]|nr:hypothetical protein [Thermoleophilia bacterium]
MSDTPDTNNDPAEPLEVERMSVEQLQGLLEAPDLTKGERRELQRAIRFHRRVELWETRQANPTPAKAHRVIISVAMMGACLGMLYLLIFKS